MEDENKLELNSNDHIYYTFEEMLAVNELGCTITKEFLSEFPFLELRCCGNENCVHHKTLNHINAPQNIEMHKVKDDQNNLAVDSVLKGFHKLSLEDLIKYKQKNTQPIFVTHENAEINPLFITNLSNIENVSSIDNSNNSSSVSYANNNKNTEDVKYNDTAVNQIRQIYMKFKGNQDTLSKPKSPVHSSEKENVTQNNALNPNFHTLLKLYPDSVRRKYAMENKVSSSTDSSIANSVDSDNKFHNIQKININADNFCGKPAAINTKFLVKENKTVVPTGTLQSILKNLYIENNGSANISDQHILNLKDLETPRTCLSENKNPTNNFIQKNDYVKSYAKSVNDLCVNKTISEDNGALFLQTIREARIKNTTTQLKTEQS